MSDATPGAGLDATLRGFRSGQKVFNRYTMIRTLGRGGMGIVWLAHDDQLEREVALKFVPELIVLDPAVLNDLKRETKRSLELTHKNIVRIYDFVHDNDSACISMEYIDGGTLSGLRVQKEQEIFEPDEIADWIGQLSDALDYAHNHARIVHRDLKPSNLMVNERGDLKIADFGIARSLSDSVSMLTHARGTSGTLVYMSPQQLDGERGTHLDDIYSLGATIYDLLTSRPPFYSGNIDRQIREKIPPPMAQRRRDLEIEGSPIPKNWEETVAACLSKDPAKRPQSATELARRLGLSLSGRAPAPGQKLQRSLRKIPPLISQLWEDIEARAEQTKPVLIAAVLICAALLAFIFLRHPTTQKITESTRSPAPVPAITASPAVTSPPASELLAPDRLLKEATALRDRGDYSKAAELYQKAAEQGDPTAQANLGWLYDQGKGVAQNYSKAAEFYQKASEQGNKTAQYNLGILYEQGKGVSQNYSKAAELYQRASDQADPDARYSLGILYEHGKGVARDYSKAAELYRKAADQGNGQARENLRRLEQAASKQQATTTSSTAEKSKTRPLLRVWMKTLGEYPGAHNVPPLRAIDQGVLVFSIGLHGTGLKGVLRPWDVITKVDGAPVTTSTQFWQAIETKKLEQDVELMVWRDDQMTKVGITPGELGLAKARDAELKGDSERAIQLTKEAADQGHPEAQVALGDLYFEGKMVKQDYTQAAELYQKAADHNDPVGQYSLGVFYEQGKGVPQNLTTAIDLYKKAAQQGDAEAKKRLERIEAERQSTTPNNAKGQQEVADQSDPAAQYNLAFRYMMGAGVPKDVHKAVELYQKSADGGNLYAQYRLAMMLEDGEGMQQDMRKAAEYYQKSADQGFRAAESRLGDLYATGDGVPKNLGKAADLYQKASDQGNPDAQCNLGTFYENGTGVAKDIAKAADLFRKSAAQGNATAKLNLERLSAAPNPLTQNGRTAQAWVGDFVRQFVGANQSPDPGLTLAYYGTSVDYFDEKKKDQAYIRQDIEKYNQRWPIRHDEIEGDVHVQEKVPGQQYSANFKLNFYAESVPRNIWTKGLFAVDLDIAIVDGNPKITSIREKTLQQQKGRPGISPKPRTHR